MVSLNQLLMTITYLEKSDSPTQRKSPPNRQSNEAPYLPAPVNGKEMQPVSCLELLCRRSYTPTAIKLYL